MHWIYILLCEDDIYYVGETTRLYRRFDEHISGEGGVNTSTYGPIEVVAIYKLDKLVELLGLRDDHRYVENLIAETLMMNDNYNWENIRGGKYTKFDCSYNKPSKIDFNLPFCHCKLPCDVNCYEGKLYYRCPKKNMYEGFEDNVFNANNNMCKYYELCEKEITERYNRKQKKIELIKKSFWLRDLVGGIYEFCVGGCGKTYNPYDKIIYNGRSINLCTDCFIDKYDELKKKYTSNPRYIDTGRLLK